MSKHRPWTDDEMGYITDTMDHPAQEVADHLGRELGAVYSRRSVIRRGWVPISRAKPWTEHDEEYVIANAQMSAEEAARHLGRTTRSVQSKRAALQAAGALGRLPYGRNVSPHKCGGRPLIAKTCPDCGLLLQAMWFRPAHNGGGWSRKCRRCYDGKSEDARAKDRSRAPRSSVLSKRAFQQMTLPHATNNGAGWVEEDMRILSNPDLTPLEKAIRLKRSYFAVENALGRNGFKSKIGLGDPERDQWMIANPNVDRVEEISAKFKPVIAEVLEPVMAGRSGRPDFDWDD